MSFMAAGRPLLLLRQVRLFLRTVRCCGAPASSRVQPRRDRTVSNQHWKSANYLVSPSRSSAKIWSLGTYQIRGSLRPRGGPRWRLSRLFNTPSSRQP
ncbi:hypothetical protein QBC45DRAFT_403194 [Copromyces sp. CBS 386.78]|nr:hypothetical protein QBC45DRAFT_403194 [Copromyces sp. CBS 386.78]